MKISVYSSYCDYSSSMDIEYDASNKDEVKEAEKYLELHIGNLPAKDTSEEDLKELLKTHCLAVTPVTKE